MGGWGLIKYNELRRGRAGLGVQLGAIGDLSTEAWLPAAGTGPMLPSYSVLARDGISHAGRGNRELPLITAPRRIIAVKFAKIKNKKRTPGTKRYNIYRC